MHAYSGGWRSKHTVDTAFSKLCESFCGEWNLQETLSTAKIAHLKIQKWQHQKASKKNTSQSWNDLILSGTTKKKREEISLKERRQVATSDG